jgi:hypothetical protein
MVLAEYYPARRIPCCLYLLFVVFVGLGSGVGAQDTLIAVGDDWRFLRGTEEPTPDPDGNPTLDWAAVDFDDGEWEVAPTGFGYADGDDATVLDDMSGNYISVYLRHTFEVADASVYPALTFLVDYDDGFVAYLNGVEIARRLLDGTPPAFDAATSSDQEAGVLEEIPLGVLLQNGTNVLAVQGHNASIDSSDFSIIAGLIGETDAVVLCPTGASCSPGADGVTISWSNHPNQAAESISVTRDGTPIAGSPFPPDTTSVVDPDGLGAPHTYSVKATLGAPLDAVDCPGSECRTGTPITLVEVGADWRFFRGTEEPTPDPDGNPTLDWAAVDFDDGEWEVGPTGFGYADGDDATVLDDMSGSYISVYLRHTFEVADASVFPDLTFLVDYDDGFVAYLNGVEIARRGLAATLPGFDEASSDHEAGVLEEIPLGVLLQNGTNVLAVQGHNADIDSSDFSIIPGLSGLCNLSRQECLLLEVQDKAEQVPGDANQDAEVDISDAVKMIRLSLTEFFDDSMPCSTAEANTALLDWTGDTFNPGDAVALLDWLFLGGAEHALGDPRNGCLGSVIIPDCENICP